MQPKGPIIFTKSLPVFIGASFATASRGRVLKEGAAQCHALFYMV